MKRILFVALAATLLAAGCQKTEIINPKAGDAMTFSTGMSKLTKGSDADNPGDTNLQEQSFKVWAYCAYADANNKVSLGDVYDNMTAIDVTYAAGADGEDGTWGTTTDYYWPGTDKSLDFFAVSTGHVWDATQGLTATISNPGTTTNRTLVLNGYSVDADDPNDDLMVAEFVRQHQGMNGKEVSVHFKHSLAKVQFNFLTNATDENVVVNSLTVEGLKTAGTLTASESDQANIDVTTGRNTITLGWEVSDSDTGSTFTDDYDGALTLTSTSTAFATWLVLPQNIANKTVSINYTIGQGDKARNFDQIFALTRAAETDDNGNVVEGKEAFGSWDINQVVIYTINLSPNKIKFDPSVHDWATAKELEDQN